ncbi:MAG: proline iminopeptidase-family hydrolase [Elusimicrobiaceae bacterium]
MKRFPEKEGYISFRGYKVWYKIVGEKEEPGKLPVICLHGGPGTNHIYLKPLEALAATGRRVIFYDQLGGGNSDHPNRPELCTIPVFVEELGELRKQLGIEKAHIYGQSWGGMLAMEYEFTKPQGVASLILSDSLASTDSWMREARRLRSELPADLQATLKRHEDAGTTDSPEYQEGMMVYYKRHICRLEPWPDFLNRSLAEFGKAPEVYLTMWGPSEFFVTGTLKNWDIRGRLGEIDVPTLILSGRYDESTPLVSGELHNGIRGSRWVMFEKSAHMPHVEETELYMKTLGNFLSEVEKH